MIRSDEAEQDNLEMREITTDEKKLSTKIGEHLKQKTLEQIEKLKNQAKTAKSIQKPQE